MQVTATTLEKVGSGSNKFYRVYDVTGAGSFNQWGAQDARGGRINGQWRNGGVAKTTVNGKLRDGYTEAVPPITYNIPDAQFKAASLKDQQKILQDSYVAAARSQSIDINQGVDWTGRQYGFTGSGVAASSSGGSLISPGGGLIGQAPVQGNAFYGDKMVQFSEKCLDAIVLASDGKADEAALAFAALGDDLDEIRSEYESLLSYFNTLELLVQNLA